MKYYTVNEIAEIIKIKPQSVRNAISKKQIKIVKILGSTRISQDELDRLVVKKEE